MEEEPMQFCNQWCQIRHELQQTSYISVSVTLIQLQETSNIVLELYWTTFKVFVCTSWSLTAFYHHEQFLQKKITVYKFGMT